MDSKKQPAQKTAKKRQSQSGRKPVGPRRMETGISGLDEVLGGGVAEGRGILVTNTTATLLGGESITETDISTLTDSIILLRYVETGGKMRRGITIIKMRGSMHDKEIMEYEITGDGMNVLDPFEGVNGIMTGAPHMISSTYHGRLIGSHDEALKQR